MYVHYEGTNMDDNEKTTRTFGHHIVQASADVSLCAGCNACEIVCSLVHDGVVGPNYNRVFMEKGTQSMITVIHSCQQCSDHPCYEACARKDQAMCLDETGIIYINEEFCIGCKRCIKACVFDPPRINYVKSSDKALRKAKKCDLCRKRTEGPACIQYCQVSCLSLG